MVSRKRTFENPIGEVFEACEKTMRHLNWNLQSSDPRRGRIEAKTDTTLRSWGEVIEISITETINGSQVHASSSPIAQITDWGKGKGNIGKFFELLNDILGA